MGLHSGKFGVVNGVDTVRNWSVNDQQTSNRFVASNTRGGSGRRRGVRSWAGSFGGFGGQPAVLPGEFFTFEGFTAPDNDASGTGEVWSGTAYVDSMSMVWNWASGSLLEWTINFSGHLALSHASGSLDDVTIPDPEEVCGTRITYPTTEWQNLAQATFNLQCPSVQYVNSSSVVSGVCWTGRKKGIFDWTLAVVEQDDDRDPALEIGTDHKLKLWIDNTLFWKLHWGHVESYTGLTVDRQGGGIIQRTVNLAMNGLNGEVGEITAPDGTVLWGEAASSS